jgi:hypothetical protein
MAYTREIRHVARDFLNVGGPRWGPIVSSLRPHTFPVHQELTTASPSLPETEYADLRGPFCHVAGGELEQIQFLLGHVSVETTERCLGCKQHLRGDVNYKIGLEPSAAALAAFWLVLTSAAGAAPSSRQCAPPTLW